MNKEALKTTKNLISFIEKSPTAFQAVENAKKLLSENGYTKLDENREWELVNGGKYFVTRNMSSIIAFRIPKEAVQSGFMICASHTDSPTFKLKSECETVSGDYTRLNTEKYGGMIISSWFDRPLSVAGRAIIKKEGHIIPVSVNIDRDLLVIPNVAIHMNRAVNEGFKFNPAVDTLPLFKCRSDSKASKGIYDLAAAAVGVNRKDLLGADLYLYNRTKGSIMGADNEFFSAPRIDNLMCAYSTLMGFISSSDCASIPVWCSFDNEETGSESKQGAASDFLYGTLSAVCEKLGKKLSVMLPSSFMVSADNGHAKHPNHPELSDGMNAPAMNGGVVIKYNASQRYTTDALSAAIFTEICENARVPLQRYNNRSDMPGGSTLGSISNTKVSLNTVDIGLAQLAMHSAYETAGSADALHLVNAAKAVYETVIELDDNGYTLNIRQ